MDKRTYRLSVDVTVDVDASPGADPAIVEDMVARMLTSINVRTRDLATADASVTLKQAGAVDIGRTN